MDLGRIKRTNQDSRVIFVEKPLGVIIVAGLTLLSTLVWGFTIFLIVTLPSSLGKSGWLPLTLSNLWFYLALFFGPFAFVFFVLLVSDIRSRFLWYSLIAYWIVLFVYLVWFYTSGGLWGYMCKSIVGTLLYSTPFIYTIGSSIYFFTNEPREYFHVKK